MKPPDLRERLFNEAIQGSERSLGNLMALELEGVRVDLHRMVGAYSSVDLSDILQLTALVSLENFGTFRGTYPSFRPWLRKIARNNLFDAIRALQVESLFSTSYRHDSSPPTPLEALVEQEASEVLRRGVQKLRRDQSIVIERTYFEQRSGKSIAQQLKRSRGAVALLKNRALSHLRENVGDYFSA